MSIRIRQQDQPDVSADTTKDSYNGAYYLAGDNSNLYEVQRSNHFEFLVTGLNNLVRVGTDGSNASDTFANAEEYIRIAVDSSSVPHFSQAALELKRGNTSIFYAGDITFETHKLTLNDYIGAEILDILMAWQNLSGNPETERIGQASSYKKTGSLIEYTPDGQVVRTWTLSGCWIKGLSEDEFSHSGNADLRRISAEIQYDKAKIDV